MGIMTVNGKPINIGGGSLNVSPVDTDVCILPTEITNINYNGATCSVSVSGLTWNNTVVTDACDWIVTTSPVIPTTGGTVNNVQICANLTTSCRSGVICYIPYVGTTKCVTVCQSTGDTEIYVTPSEITDVCGDGWYYSTCVKVCGPPTNTVCASGSTSWIIACNSSISPSAAPGTTSCVRVCCNTGVAREGYVLYTPTIGTPKCVCICQNECITWKCVDMCQYACYGTDGSDYVEKLNCVIYNPSILNGDCYCLVMFVDMEAQGIYGQAAQVCITCNGACKYCCRVTNNSASEQVSFGVDYNDIVRICLYALDPDLIYYNYASVFLGISDCTGSASQFCLGSTCTDATAWTTGF